MVFTYHRRDHVYARMHHDNRTFIRDISVSTTGKKEHSAQVARSADGRFSIAFVIDVNSGDIRLRRCNAKGDLVQHRTVAASKAAESDLSVSMNNRGDTLIGWRSLTHFVSGGFENFDNAVQARMVYYTGRLGPVRTFETGFYVDDVVDGSLKQAGGFEVDAPHLSLQQDGGNDLFVVVFQQSTAFDRENRHTEYVVYVYSEARALDRGELDEHWQQAIVSWSRNTNEAIVAWAESERDIQARIVTI